MELWLALGEAGGRGSGQKHLAALAEQVCHCHLDMFDPQVEPVPQNVGRRVVSWVVQNWQGVVAVVAFVVAVAAAFFSKVQADGAVDASDEVKIRKAVQNFLQPYQPKRRRSKW